MAAACAGLAPGCAPPQQADPHAAAVIERSIATVRAGRGSGCGTPDVAAAHDVEQLGARAVPLLFERAERPEDADVRREIEQWLAAITCCPARMSEPPGLAGLRAWWSEHEGETHGELTLAAWEQCDGDVFCGTSCTIETLDEDVVARLESWLGPGRPALRRQARFLLATRGRPAAVVADIRRSLRAADLEERNDALHVIADVRLDELAPEVLSALAEDPDLAETAASVAATMELRAAVPLIEEREARTNGLMRARLLRSLWLLVPERALPRIAALVESGTEEERDGAFAALAGSAQPEAHALMLRGLSDRSPQVVSRAAWALSMARSVHETTRLAAARAVFGRAAPTTTSMAGDPTFAIDDLLMRFAIEDGRPFDLVDRKAPFDGESFELLHAWWQERLSGAAP